MSQPQGHPRGEARHANTMFSTWILGVSLGDERTLRLESKSTSPEKRYEIQLSSGSVYLQKSVAARP